MERYEGTHQVRIDNFGEDTDSIQMDLTYDELMLVLKIRDKLREVHRPYAPQLIVDDITANKDIANKELKEKFEKRNKRNNKPFKNNQLKEALMKARYFV